MNLKNKRIELIGLAGGLGVVVALAPASLRIPVADRRKGVGFAALITALVAARLGSWLLAP